MFDFSFGELALIALVALLVVGPEDLPVVVRTLRGWFKQFKSITNEFKSSFKEVIDEVSLKDVKDDLEDVHTEVQYIRDEQGKLQRVYDISDFLEEKEKSKS